MRIESITSAQNPKVKLLLELQEKSKTRRKEGLFVVEGQRELLHCIGLRKGIPADSSHRAHGTDLWNLHPAVYPGLCLW